MGYECIRYQLHLGCIVVVHRFSHPVRKIRKIICEYRQLVVKKMRSNLHRFHLVWICNKELNFFKWCLILKVWQKLLRQSSLVSRAQFLCSCWLWTSHGKIWKIMHYFSVFALWSNRGFADPVSILWIISPGFAVKIKSDTFSSWTF